MVIAAPLCNVAAANCNNGSNPNNPPLLRQGLGRPGKVLLRILQMNVEGWTSSKREILQQITEKHFANIVLVQEAHQTRQDQLKLHEF